MIVVGLEILIRNYSQSALEGRKENMKFTPLFLSSSGGGAGTVRNLDEQLLFCDTRFCPRGTCFFFVSVPSN